MKILIFSDLHLGDLRHPAELEALRLEALAALIRKLRPAAVLNLGDTVSRAKFLRENEPGGEIALRRYKKWRDELNIPFLECALGRESEFFQRVFDQKPDFVWEEIPETAVITLSPREASDHLLTEEQLAWLAQQLKRISAPTVLIASHVPFPGACSRPEKPGIFLDTPSELQRILEECGKRIFWTGGHFHWACEPPRERFGVTSFMGGRFELAAVPEKKSYLRVFETESNEISTIENIAFL